MADVASGIHDELPLWMVWAYLPVLATVCFVAGASVVAVGAGVAGRVARGGGEHWTERARRIWPQRVVAGALALWAPAFLGFVEMAVGRLGNVAVTAVVVVLAALTGSWFVAARVEAQARGLPTELGRPLRGVAVTLLAVFPFAFPILVAPPFCSAAFDVRSLAVLVATALLVLWSSKIALLLAGFLGLARPASPEVHELAVRAAAPGGLRPRPTLVLRWGVANALAFPTEGRVAFSERALEILSREELAAIAAHEVGHLREPWGVRTTRRLQPLTLLPFVVIHPLVVAGGVALVFGVLAASVTLYILVAFALKRRELVADRAASSLDAAVYAGALEKLYADNLIPADLGRSTATHPALYDRLLAMGETPSFPRPAVPSSTPVLVGLGAALLSLLMLGIAGIFASIWVAYRLEQPAALRAHIALVGPTRVSVEMLGASLQRAGRYSEAEKYHRHLLRVRPRDQRNQYLLVEALAGQGKCTAAAHLLQEVPGKVAGEDCASEALSAFRAVARCGEAP